MLFQKCPMFMPNWLLLQVKPRQELRALANLERQKGECYCPQIKVEKLSRGKRIQVVEALFPGYLFINAQPEINGLSYTSIRSSRGVSKIVGFGEEFIKIPESLIQQLKRREIEGLTCTKVGGLPQQVTRSILLKAHSKGCRPYIAILMASKDALY
jgi:transcriptional antiterminator RfaH